MNSPFEVEDSMWRMKKEMWQCVVGEQNQQDGRM
jgi:hypothetical protein